MNYSSNRGFPAGNPIANLLVVVVGALAIAASLVLGFFAFLLLASLIVVFASIVAIRVWWIRRKLRRQKPAAADEGRDRSQSTVIEGEFRVLENDRSDKDSA